MLQPGITHTVTTTVTQDKTASAVGSGGLDVFGTPAMIGLMEMCCLQAVQPLLNEGQGTVGTVLNVRHLAATPLGLQVRCECELQQVEGKRLLFAVRAYDPAGLIGEGTHERFIVDNERFMQRTLQKLEELQK